MPNLIALLRGNSHIGGGLENDHATCDLVNIENLQDSVVPDPATHDNSASSPGRNTISCPTHENLMTIVHARDTRVCAMIVVCATMPTELREQAKA